MIKYIAGVAFIVAVAACSQPISEQAIQATVEAAISATQSVLITTIQTQKPEPTPTPTETITPTPSLTPAPTEEPTALTPAPTEEPTAIPIVVNIVPTSTLSPTPTPSAGDVIRGIEGAVVRIVTPYGSGSGFIIDKDGWILTNAHVVEGVDEVNVIIDGLYEITGVVGKTITGIDLAAVRINGDDLASVVELGDSASMGIGDEVWAIGYPLGSTLGDSASVTKGIVSSHRVFPPLNYFQTDAAINPGSSGGPLINSRGEVVGINTSRVEYTVGRPVEGIGLAITINDAKALFPFLMDESASTIPTPLPEKRQITKDVTSNEHLLEMISLDCYQNRSLFLQTATAEGRIKNVSDQKINGLEVIVDWQNALDQSLGSGSSVLANPSLNPGQSSTFKVTSVVSPGVASCHVGFQDANGRSTQWIYKPSPTPTPLPTSQPEGYFSPVIVSPEIGFDGGWSYTGRGDVLLKPLSIDGYYGSDYEIYWSPLGTGSIIVSGKDSFGGELFRFKVKSKTVQRVTLVPGISYSIAVDPISQAGKWKISISPVDPEITSDAMSTISTDYELTEIRGRDWELKYTVTVANDSDQALKVDIILYLTDQSGYHVDHFKVETGAWFIPGSERTFVGSIVVDSNKAENYRTLDVQFGRPDN